MIVDSSFEKLLEDKSTWSRVSLFLNKSAIILATDFFPSPSLLKLKSKTFIDLF